MKLDRKYVERISVLLRYMNDRIADLSKDVSMVAEVRAVRTLRDGVIQALQCIELNGLYDDPAGPRIDLDQAAIPADEFGNPKFVVNKFSSEKIFGRESQPFAIRFSINEREVLRAFADSHGVTIADVVKSSLIFAGVIKG